MGLGRLYFSQVFMDGAFPFSTGASSWKVWERREDWKVTPPNVLPGDGCDSIALPMVRTGTSFPFEPDGSRVGKATPVPKKPQDHCHVSQQLASGSVRPSCGECEALLAMAAPHHRHAIHLASLVVPIERSPGRPALHLRYAGASTPLLHPPLWRRNSPLPLAPAGEPARAPTAFSRSLFHVSSPRRRSLARAASIERVLVRHWSLRGCACKPRKPHTRCVEGRKRRRRATWPKRTPGPTYVRG